MAKVPHLRAAPVERDGSADVSVRHRAEISSRQRAYRWAAAIVLLTAPTDIHSHNHHLFLGWGVRVAMAGCCWACAGAVGQAAPRRYALLKLAASYSVCLLYWVLVVTAGGAAGPDFDFTIVMPLAGVLIGAESLWFAVPFSMFSALLGMALVSRAGGNHEAVLLALGQRLAAGGLAVVAAHYYARLRTNEVALSSQLDEARARFATAERLALVGQLAAGVAHEINNPLAFVKSNLAFLVEEIPQSYDELVEVLKETQVGVERMQKIVADLKGFAREDDGRAEPCRLEELVDEALRVTQHRVQVVAQVEKVLDSDVLVQARRHLLLQVLINLLVNASDALASAGRRNGLIQIVAKGQSDGRVEIKVTDNGPGLSPMQLSRLFTPFFTTKAPGKGTGLGLALCRAHLEKDGGTIEAGNAPGGGACFRLLLPAPPPTSAVVFPAPHWVGRLVPT